MRKNNRKHNWKHIQNTSVNKKNNRAGKKNNRAGNHDDGNCRFVVYHVSFVRALTIKPQNRDIVSNCIKELGVASTAASERGKQLVTKIPQLNGKYRVSNDK